MNSFERTKNAPILLVSVAFVLHFVPGNRPSTLAYVSPQPQLRSMARLRHEQCYSFAPGRTRSDLILSFHASDPLE
jgi:hypothetical protein